MTKKIISVIVAIIVVMSLFTCSASAASIYAPYHSYEYNKFGEVIQAPTGYTLEASIDANYLGLDIPFDTPTDITYVNGVIYVLDGKNSRVVAFDEDYKLIREYKNFTIDAELAEEKEIIVSPEGYVMFGGADGLEVTKDGRIIIADTTGNRVLCADMNCHIDTVILRPDEALNDTEVFFAPDDILVDEMGRIYITSNNIALGVMIFTPEGEFIEFYGASEVLSTTQAFIKFFREVFMSVTQLELVERATPVSISNMDFSKEGFMYTVLPYGKDETANLAVTGLVRKMNYKAEDLLDTTLIFGDTIPSSDGVRTHFHDVDVDEDGFINLMDQTRGRVFQYTDTGTLITVFGSNSDQAGCFGNGAMALESVGKKVLVLDRGKNSVFAFAPTEYILNVRSAVLKMNNNDLEGSEEEWHALLKSNSNSYLCYEGLGRISDYKGEYKQAMEYYKLAYDQAGYAQAFQQHRQILIEENALWVILAAVILIVAFWLISKYLKRFTVPVEGSAYSKLESKGGMPFYVLFHPIDGFAQFKPRKLASVGISAFIAILWLIIAIVDYNASGFAFNINRSVDFNMPVTMLLTVGIYIMFCVANWAICTLLEGKGTLKDIFATAAYSLIPYLVSLVLKTVLSNVLTPQEGVFIGIITTIGVLWTATVLILGMVTIHEFSVTKTIVSLILTIAGMVAIVFLAILLYSLMKQMFSFFVSVYKEIDFRI